MFMTRSLNVTPKTTERHLIVSSDKSVHSVAYVTNNKRLCLTFCTVEAKYTDRHEASRNLFATAELLVASLYRCCPMIVLDCFGLILSFFSILSRVAVLSAI